MRGKQGTMNLNPLATRKPRATCACGCGQVGPIVGRGLRGRCYMRESKAGTLENWPKTPRNGKRQPMPAADPPSTPSPESTRSTPPNRLPETLNLMFDGADLTLYDRLEEDAKACRRTAEQQALFYLETYLSDPPPRRASV